MKKKVVALTTIALLSSTFATNTYASTYKVQKGDTLYQIAKKYNTTVSNLKEWNNLDSDLLSINQTLQVAKESPVPIPQEKNQAPSETTYTIVKGDTLLKIAKNYNISLSDLMSWNNLTNHIIYPGQLLKVSSSSNNIQQPPTVVEKAPSQPESVPEVLTPPLTNITYVVQKGDTLSQISLKYGTSIKQIKELNKLSSDLIFIGQNLIITSSSDNLAPDSKRENETKTETNTPTEPAANVDLISSAKSLLGVPYLWAGSTPKGFDCSGFIYYAFKSVGKNVSRLSTDGYYSRSYYVDTPQIGDLVFFENTYRKGISHMGIYLGNNQFIHASSSKGVTISSINEAYYQQRLDGFKRFY